MEINKTTSYNQNFQGFKNIISHSQKMGENTRFTNISLQLDNLKNKDLKIWQDIQKLSYNIDNSSDIITIQNFSNGPNNVLFINGESINLDTLKKSSIQEMYILKLLTFVASLTRRMMNSNLLTKDKDIQKTISKTTAVFKNYFFDDDRKSYNYINQAILENQPSQENALYVNKSITEEMKKYFKV